MVSRNFIMHLSLHASYRIREYINCRYITVIRINKITNQNEKFNCKILRIKNAANVRMLTSDIIAKKIKTNYLPIYVY